MTKLNGLHEPPYRAVYYKAHDTWDVVGPATATENQQYSVLDDLTEEDAVIVAKVLNMNSSSPDILDKIMQMLNTSSMDETIGRLYNMLERESAIKSAEE